MFINGLKDGTKTTFPVSHCRNGANYLKLSLNFLRFFQCYLKWKISHDLKIPYGVKDYRGEYIYFNLCLTCAVVFFSEKDILNHDDEYEPFFSSFVALASHYLSSSAGDGEFKS